MRGGRLRHVLELHRKVVTRNEHQEEVVEYELWKTRRCRLIPQSVTQQYQADRVTATANVVFSIRYTEGVEPTMRVLFQGRWLDLVGQQNPDDKRSEMTLTCVETVND